MFLNDGRVVFSQLMILFIFSNMSFVIAIVLLGCVSFGSVVFSFSKVGSSFSLDCFCLTPLNVSILYYTFVYVFFDGFLVFQGQKTNPY